MILQYHMQLPIGLNIFLPQEGFCHISLEWCSASKWLSNQYAVIFSYGLRWMSTQRNKASIPFITSCSLITPQQPCHCSCLCGMQELNDMLLSTDELEPGLASAAIASARRWWAEHTGYGSQICTTTHCSRAFHGLLVEDWMTVPTNATQHDIDVRSCKR